MTSPDDPVFFLHHCFIDKLWADWQREQRRTNADAAPHYCPERGGPDGHNLKDTLRPWNRTIEEMLDTETLGYNYEPTPEGDVEGRRALDVTVPAWVRDSPFWAD